MLVTLTRQFAFTVIRAVNAPNRTRTDTMFPSEDFKSSVSANSTIGAMRSGVRDLNPSSLVYKTTALTNCANSQCEAVFQLLRLLYHTYI